MRRRLKENRKEKEKGERAPSSAPALPLGDVLDRVLGGRDPGAQPHGVVLHHQVAEVGGHPVLVGVDAPLLATENLSMFIH